MDIHTSMIYQFLCSQPLFKGVSDAGLAVLAKAGRLKHVSKDSTLFFQMDPASAVYLVRTGAVAIMLENADGRELVINEMGPGDCFGELGVLTGNPHSTSAKALVDSEIAFIPRAAFLAVLEQELCLALQLLELTARRLMYSTEREESLAFHDAQQRLARQLLYQDRMACDKGYLTLSQEELAQRTGLTRQTVATILGRWRRLGWLLTGRGHVVLLNRRELNLLVEPFETTHEN
jgi:CRP-like cAMP-binding protein